MPTDVETRTLAGLLDPPPRGLSPRLAWSLALAGGLHLLALLGPGVTVPQARQPAPESMLEVLLINNPGELLERAPDDAALARLNRRGESTQGDGSSTLDGQRPRAQDERLDGAADLDRRVDVPPQPPLAALPAESDAASPPAERAAPLATLEPSERPSVMESAFGEAPALASGQTSEVRPRVDAARILASATDEIARLSADLQARVDAYASRERRRSISASTREFRYASYLGAWARKVERIGTINYPQAAKEQQLFGSLILHVAVRADGSVERIRVVRSSGHALLDEAAIHIVELAAPFAPFPPDIAAETDVLDIVRTWQFLRGGGLGWDQ